MAKRKPARAARKATAGRKAAGKRSAKRSRPAVKSRSRVKTRKRAGASPKRTRKAVRLAAKGTRTKTPRLDRPRRVLEESVPTPPSSLDMRRRGSAVRTGRAEIAESLEDHRGMTGLTGGDVDVDAEGAYFTGDEAPGGDNPTPDQDIVDNIGKALGVEYQDNEELQASDKVTKRDKHRWELDPASSEDYKERK